MNEAAKGLYQRPGSPYWNARFQVNGSEVRVSLKTKDLGEAKRRREDLVSKASKDGLELRRSDWAERCRAAANNSQSWLRRHWGSANARNRRRGITRSVSINFVYLVALRSGGRCAVTGIPFQWDGDRPLKGAYAISLDRIDSSKPYSSRNCRMVLQAVNVAMNAWGSDVFWDVARHAVGRQLQGDGTKCAQLGKRRKERGKDHV